MFDTSNVAPVVIALACIFAFGVASTTLESTISTKPGEVIDPDYEALQIDGDDVGDMKDRVQENKGRNSDESAPSKSSNQDGKGEEATGPSEEKRLGKKPGDPDESLLDMLLALLAKLLFLIPIAVAVLGAYVAYRYRDQIFDWLLGSGGAEEPGRGRVDPWEGVEPSNVVQRAWFEMVRRVDVNRPRSKTPAEWENAARTAGMDPEAVELVTDAFRAAAYSDGEVSDVERDAARQGLERLNSDSRGTSR